MNGLADDLLRLPNGVTYEPVPRVFAGVRAVCPRCGWRGRPLAAGSVGWATWLRHDLHTHPCTPVDQEKPCPAPPETPNPDHR